MHANLNAYTTRLNPVMGKPNEEAMKRAIKCYSNGNFSIRDAATRYGVKKSTLIDRLNGKGNKVGTPTLLSAFTVMLIVQLLISCSDIGFSLNTKQYQTIPSAQETSSETLNNKFVCYDCLSLLFDKYWKTCIDYVLYFYFF